MYIYAKNLTKQKANLQEISISALLGEIETTGNENRVHRVEENQEIRSISVVVLCVSAAAKQFSFRESLQRNFTVALSSMKCGLNWDIELCD